MKSKYSKYKSSGVVTFNEVPSHWNKNRIKYIGFMYGGLTGKSGDDFRKDEDDPTNKPFITFTNICNNTYIKRDDLKLVSINEDDNQNRVEKDDLFFMMTSETQEDVGKTSVLKEDLGEVYLNTFCKGYRITDTSVNPYFLNYLLNGKPYREILSIEGNGFTRINLRQDRVNDFIVFTPPLHEQEQIVKYLDEKTFQIDSLISITEKKIELLKQKKTSLINEVITKGLNKDVELKESGVKWIGRIPDNWVMIKLKYLFRIVKIISGELGYDVLSVTQKGLKIKNLESNEGQHSMDYSKYQIVRKGQFVMNHMDLLTGFVDISKFEGVTSPDYRVFEHYHPNVDPQYYLYIFQLCYWNKIFYGLGQGVSNLGRWRLPSDVFNDFLLPFPSLIEQNEIVIYLDTQTRLIDDLVSIEQRRIEKLNEYRQSLISDVVTGKIKVCDEVESLELVG